MNLFTNKSSAFMNKVHQTFQSLTSEYKGVVITAFTILGVLLLLLIASILEFQQNTVSTLANSETKHSLTLLHELRDVDSQLQALTASPQNSESFKNALTNLNIDLANLQQSINEVAKSPDLQKVANQIASLKEDVDSQIVDLKHTVANSQDAKQYLDPNVLPFHVISVDVISQQPFVSINYANHITPLAVGDSVAGWQIVSADYDAAQVKFKNDHNQYVKVLLQG